MAAKSDNAYVQNFLKENPSGWDRDKCWILEPERLRHQLHLFDKDTVLAAVEQLAELYPVRSHETYDSWLAEPPVVVVPSLPGMNWMAWEALYLGKDLCDAPGWKSDCGLRGEMRIRSSYWRRRVELGIWAAFRRAGMLESRIESVGGAKTPDFMLSVGGRKICVEVKTIETDETEKAMGELQHAFNQSLISKHYLKIPREMTSGVRIRLFLFDYCLDAFQYPAFRDSATDGLKELIGVAVERCGMALQSSEYPFAFEVPSLGHIFMDRTAEPDSFDAGIANLLSTSVQKKIDRCRRTLRNASKQRMPDHPLVVLVHASVENLKAEAIIYRLRDSLLDQSTFGGLDGVVIQNSYRDRNGPGRMVTTTAHFRTTWSDLDENEIRLVARASENWKYMV